MKNLITFMLLISVVFSVDAQRKKHKQDVPIDSLTFTGQVFDKETLKPLPKSIYSLHHRIFVTDENGRFRFSANEGDTIMFRNIGYKDLYLIVADSLSNEEYLTGVYLSQDQIQLSEVLVVPRYYDVETLVKTSSTEYEDQQIAEKNMNMSAYQALMPNTNWDAETNQKYALAKETMRVEYKGMVAPDKMFGANVITVVPEAVLTYGPNKAKPIDMGAVTTQEEVYLQTVFGAIMERRREEMDSVKQVKTSPLAPIKR